MVSLARLALIAATTSLVTVSFAGATATTWVKKSTSEDWTWFEDYVYAWAKYAVACEPDRRCQVGMGVYAFGEPLGEKMRFNGQIEVLVIGIGSLHIRPADGKGPVKAAIAQKGAGLIEVSWDF
jgi:hypothetical protein